MVGAWCNWRVLLCLMAVRAAIVRYMSCVAVGVLGCCLWRCVVVGVCCVLFWVVVACCCVLLLCLV